VESMTIKSGKIAFRQEFNNKKKVTGNVPATNPSIPAPQVLVWAPKWACKVETAIYEVIHLERPRAITFAISSGTNEITKAKLVIKSGTAGLRLHVADAEVLSGDCKIIHANQASTVNLGSIQANTVVKLRVAYKLEADVKEVSFRSELEYETETGKFTFGDSHHVPVLLPLGVNVQDVFKKKALFSKFAISTSSHVPIRVLGSKLTENEEFAVASPYSSHGGLVVFAKQPASFVYRITKKVADSLVSRRKLSMEIDYRCLDDEVVCAVERSLQKAIYGSEWERYLALLESAVRFVLQQRAQQQELEVIGLLQEISLGRYEDFNWTAILAGISPEDRTPLQDWLKKWHEVG
jgi:trafficking protein particle complex subunit 10